MGVWRGDGLRWWWWQCVECQGLDTWGTRRTWADAMRDAEDHWWRHHATEDDWIRRVTDRAQQVLTNMQQAMDRYAYPIPVPPYCRTHGVRADDCGCASTPVQPANDTEAPGDPNAPKVAQILHAQARTSDCDPLHRAHNEGTRR